MSDFKIVYKDTRINPNTGDIEGNECSPQKRLNLEKRHISPDTYELELRTGNYFIAEELHLYFGDCGHTHGFDGGLLDIYFQDGDFVNLTIFYAKVFKTYITFFVSLIHKRVRFTYIRNVNGRDELVRLQVS